jgi:hypothetical protein
MAIFVSDDFTGGTQGDAITTHTPTVAGATWVSDTTGLQLRGDGANPGAGQSGNCAGTNFGAGRGHVPTAPGSADYEVRADMLLENADGWGNKAGLRARVEAGTFGACYECYYDEGSETWNLQKRTGGNFTQLGTPWGQAYVDDTVRAVRFVVTGTSLELYVDSVLRVSATDSSITAAGYAGIYIEGGIGDGLCFNNFIAEDAGDPPPPGDELPFMTSLGFQRVR